MCKSSVSIVLFCGALMFTSCNSKMGEFKSEYFNVNPNPLELVGTQVPGRVYGNLPAKFFKKDAEVTITPVLVYGGTEQASTSYTYQGENVRGNNFEVDYEQGGTLNFPVNYKYTPAMDKSELYLTFDVKQGKKQYALPRVKVADGVIATAALANAGTVTPATAADAFQRIINEKYSADIRFLINQANIRKSQLESKEVTDLQDIMRDAAAASNKEIEEINISSYASPDGTMAFNTRLAENREANTKEYVTGQLKKDKITEFGELTAQFTPEDWEGFRKLVAASNIQDKDLIISVLSMYKDPEEREREIRNLSSVFEVLADEILPQLRYSRITASVNVIGKSDQEISQLAKTAPSQLSVEELLYAATLTNDNGEKMRIYGDVVRLYPDDFRGYNNLGKAQYVAKDYASAAANFAKAASMAPTSREVNMNSGLVALVNEDYASANSSFGNAAGLDEVGEALGVYYLTQGDNAAAVKAFGSAKSNNAALAQILTKDYSAAKSTLAGIANPDATTYYLTAIVGARTNNASMVKTNLDKVASLDPAMAAKAKNDLEFAKFKL